MSTVAQYKPGATPSHAEGVFETTLYGLKLVVSCNDSSLIHWLGYLLPESQFGSAAESITNRGHTTAEYHIDVSKGATVRKNRYTVIRGGETVFRTRHWIDLQAFIEQSILIETARHLPDPHHLIHAGAVVRNGRGILMPSRSGSGKSTLVAALALSGFEYFSDEIGILTPRGMLLPFPKAITLKSGGWKAITGCFAGVDTKDPAVTNDRRLRHLIAPKIPVPSIMESGCSVSFIVAPRYSPDEATSLRPIPKSQALSGLVERSINLALLGKPGLDIILQVVRNAECYALTVSDLVAAVELLEQLTLQHDACPN